MNRFEYLSKLKGCLSALPAKECKAAIKYYEELFDDAGLNNEQAVISGLGSPQKLAQTILNDDGGITGAFNQTKKGVRRVTNRLNSNQTLLAIVIIILTLPVWGGILLAFAGILIGILVIALAILISLFVSGIALICMGIAYVVKTVSIGITLIGTGLAFGSITFLIFTPVTNLIFRLPKFAVKNFIKLFNKLLGRTGAIS